jgi:hypothetical protein
VAYRVSVKAATFNFEAVHKLYQQALLSKQSAEQQGFSLSKQQFIKLFLDLVDKGFLRSETESDTLSVHNKISLGFRKNDLSLLTDRNKISDLGLPQDVEHFAKFNL